MKRYQLILRGDTGLIELGEHPEGNWVHYKDHEEVIQRQANAARSGMDAAKAISSHQLKAAARLNAESSPDALESERQANAKLTQELSLAEEGLANYEEEVQVRMKMMQQKDAENERLRDLLRNVRDHGCNECLECAVAINRLIGAPEPQTAEHK